MLKSSFVDMLNTFQEDFMSLSWLKLLVWHLTAAASMGRYVRRKNVVKVSCTVIVPAILVMMLCRPSLQTATALLSSHPVILLIFLRRSCFTLGMLTLLSVHTASIITLIFHTFYLIISFILPIWLSHSSVWLPFLLITFSGCSLSNRSFHTAFAIPQKFSLDIFSLP